MRAFEMATRSFEKTGAAIGYNDAVKQARQPLAGTARCWREEGPDSTEQGDG
jgi:hypothetical protein